MKILQVSDIHLGADYGGKFDTAGQWAAVLEDAQAQRPEGYDAVIITGDLADDDPGVPYSAKVLQYRDILEEASLLCRNQSSPVLVTPGNHDNRKALTEAAQALGVISWNGADQPSGFEDVGAQCLLYELGGKTIVLLDSGSDGPYRGLSKLDAYTCDHLWDPHSALIFTHKPFRSTQLHHRFMVGTNNVMPADVGSHAALYARNYFCGHFHHWSRAVHNGMNVYACPGIQCQLDPYTKECLPIAAPGYLVIEFDIGKGSPITVQPVFLDDFGA